MKKRIISFILMLAMAIAILSPIQVKKVQAAESTSVSNWAIPDLIFGDTYGIYPLTWYNKGLTGNISKSQFRVLLYGLRRKIVDTNGAQEKRSAKPVIDDSITVQEAIDAFYTMLSNYDYTVDMGISSGSDAVSYMTQIGAYTGKNGEQSIQELCSVEQAMVIATRIVIAFHDALGTSSKGFLWEVKSGGNTAYLLGSIHMASTDIYPLSHKIWSAYFNSDALIVEANLYDQNDNASLQSLMYYSDGTTLKDHVSAETYQKAVEVAASIGLPEEVTALIKPWALYLTFSNFTVIGTSAGEAANTQLGIDANFMTNAIVYDKPIYAIEGLQKQGEILDGFSAELQEYLLSASTLQLNDIISGKTTVSADEINDSVEIMFKSWKEGDIDSFAQLSVDDGMEDFAGEITDDVKKYADEYNTKFLVQRDDAMAEYIDKLLKSEGNNTYFVVLGSLHYISDYSVIDRLEKAGYVLTQIK